MSAEASCVVAVHVQDKMLIAPSREGLNFDFHINIITYEKDI